jgi:hypothetical protein
MKKMYFTILEVGNGEAPNVGTISIDLPSKNELRIDFEEMTEDKRKEIDQTMNDKIKLACERHFDATIKISKPISLFDVYNAYAKEIYVELVDENEVTTARIEVQQTWLY